MSATQTGQLIGSPSTTLVRVGEDGDQPELLVTLTLTHLLVEIPSGEWALPLDELMEEMTKMGQRYGS